MDAEIVVRIENRKTTKGRIAGTSIAGVVILVSILVSIAALLPRALRTHTNDVSTTSLAFSKGKTRAVEPRLSGGVVWAPFRSTSHGSAQEVEVPNLRAKSAIVRALSRPSTRHATGVLQLLDGDPRAALSTLEAASSTSRDAHVWSDLAAAAYATAVRYDAPALLADALAAADTAISLDPKALEALFNRALILERLGLRDDAHEAWDRYLQSESDAGWLAEARQHLRALAPMVAFADRLDRNLPRLIGDPSAARELVAENREDARIEGTIEVLGRWAAAEVRDDHTTAESYLGIARRLGAEVDRLEGDRMLERTVAVIDAASGPALADLASAQLAYSRGIRAFWDNRPTEAEPMLHRAAEALARAQSPLALMARYYEANTIFDQGRREESCRILEGVLAETTEAFPACRAHVLSQIGACHFAKTAWGESLRAFEESEAIFQRLGETSNAATDERMISIVYDQNGDPDRAWKYRMRALQGLGGKSNLRLEKVIGAIARDAMIRRDWRTARSFLSVEIEVARRIGDDVNLAETLLFRAQVRQRLNDANGAQSDLTEGQSTTSRLKDQAYRNHLEVTALEARAMLTPSPAEAQNLLTEAIAFEIAKGDPEDVPRLLLQRARARRASGDPKGAAADLDRGIAELETARATLPEGEARWGAFHSAAELFEDAIDLAIDADDVAKAFRVSEKARARALLESWGHAGFDPRQLPPDTVIVEYAALPSRLVIFTADASGIDAVAVEYDRDTLVRSVDRLSHDLRAGEGEAKRDAPALWRQLLGPVATPVDTAKNVVFVPDSATASIPFSALVDPRGQYLIETHDVVVAPSAAVFLAARKRQRRASPPRSVLVVANSRASGDAGALTFVTTEANRVAREFATSVRLMDDDAQYDQLLAHASGADVLHFAGHAIGDSSGLEPASIVLRQNGQERRIGVAAIAALPLRHTFVVVLAGCNTARGERRDSEGIISVAHGFLTAGAPSVIATLWSIDDELAARVFPRLHALLAQGLPPAEALRTVQIESIHRGDVPASLWAALRVMGS